MAPNPNTRWPSPTRSTRSESGPEPQYQRPSEERILRYPLLVVVNLTFTDYVGPPTVGGPEHPASIPSAFPRRGRRASAPSAQRLSSRGPRVEVLQGRRVLMVRDGGDLRQRELDVARVHRREAEIVSGDGLSVPYRSSGAQSAVRSPRGEGAPRVPHLVYRHPTRLLRRRDQQLRRQSFMLGLRAIGVDDGREPGHPGRRAGETHRLRDHCGAQIRVGGEVDPHGTVGTASHERAMASDCAGM